MLVRYDELVNDPDPTLRRVLAHVGAPFERACMLEERVEFKWPSDPLLLGPIVHQQPTWRQHISLSDAQHVERQLSHEMAAMSFRPYTTGVA
jgi:hypothetical protein